MGNDEKEIIKKRMKDGWIKSWMMIEVMAISEDAAKSALTGHVEKISQEPDAMVYNVKYADEVTKVDNPIGNIKTGYSYVVEFEIIVSNFDRLLTLVMNYGPSSVEILEPESIKMTLDQAQGALNSVSGMLHKFASQAGGVVISS